jgi:hypothetical protein
MIGAAATTTRIAVVGAGSVGVTIADACLIADTVKGVSTSLGL